MMGRWKSCEGPSGREEGEARDDVIEEEEGETEEETALDLNLEALEKTLRKQEQ